MNPVWKSMNEVTKNAVKDNAIRALANCSERNFKFKICESAIQICENCYEDDEEWPALLEYLYLGFKSELTESTFLLIETSVYILSQIFGYIYEELSNSIDLYVKAFSNLFCHGQFSS